MTFSVSQMKKHIATLNKNFDSIDTTIRKTAENEIGLDKEGRLNPLIADEKINNKILYSPMTNGETRRPKNDLGGKKPLFTKFGQKTYFVNETITAHNEKLVALNRHLDNQFLYLTLEPTRAYEQEVNETINEIRKLKEKPQSSDTSDFAARYYSNFKIEELLNNKSDEDIPLNIPLNIGPYTIKKMDSNKTLLSLNEGFKFESEEEKKSIQDLLNKKSDDEIKEEIKKYLNDQYKKIKKEHLEELGPSYLKDSIKFIQKNKKPTIYIVLGSKNENTKIYKSLGWGDPEKQNNKIQKYKLEKEKIGNEIKNDLTIYDINAHKGETELNSDDIELLHDIVTKIKNKKHNVVIHCQEGVDRTGKLAFAFELFRNFPFFFETNKTEKHIKFGLDRLRASRSPILLTGKKGFAEAILLAQTLNAVDIQKQTRQALENYIKNFNKKGLQEEKRKAIDEILEKLDKESTLKDKIDCLNNQLIEKQGTLNRQRNFSYFQTKLFGIKTRELPTSLRLLQNFKSALELRERTEFKTLQLMNKVEKVFLFDRDSTLIDEKGNLINKEKIETYLKSIIQNPKFKWGIVSTGANDRNEDKGLKAIKAARIEYHQNEPAYPLPGPTNESTINGFTTAKDTNLKINETIDQKNNKELIKKMLASGTLEDNKLTYSGNDKEYTININKNSHFKIKLGNSIITINVKNWFEKKKEHVRGKNKLFQSLLALDELKIRLECTNELKKLGINNITTPKTYKDINPKDIVMTDDNNYVYALMEAAGFTAIHAVNIETITSCIKNICFEINNIKEKINVPENIKNDFNSAKKVLLEETLGTINDPKTIRLKAPELANIFLQQQQQPSLNKTLEAALKALKEALKDYSGQKGIDKDKNDYLLKLKNLLNDLFNYLPEKDQYLDKLKNAIGTQKLAQREEEKLKEEPRFEMLGAR